MASVYTESKKFSDWTRRVSEKGRPLMSVDMEITRRCNNNCRHCYVNLPANDAGAESREMTAAEILEIARQAVSLGAVWWLLSGGEPLLRDDFRQIYLGLKKMGLLVSVFTNATLIDRELAQMFKQYPPRQLEITVYGVTAETYDRVSGIKGSFAKFQQGIDWLKKFKVAMDLKAMVMQSNLGQYPQIADFCRQHSRDAFRFDPFLHARYDGDDRRNAQIRAERLKPEQVLALERSDPQRFALLQKDCQKIELLSEEVGSNRQILNCGAGRESVSISAEGMLHPCGSLWHPDYLYDLKSGSLEDAWKKFIPKAINREVGREEDVPACSRCVLANLCIGCVAHCHLETGRLDQVEESFCEMARARTGIR